MFLGNVINYSKNCFKKMECNDFTLCYLFFLEFLVCSKQIHLFHTVSWLYFAIFPVELYRKKTEKKNIKKHAK